MPDEDLDQAPVVHEEVLDEVQKTQINRMAGCARYGKWILWAAFILLIVYGLKGFL